MPDARPPDPSGAPAWLLGRWRLVHAGPSLGFTPGTRMEFAADGTLAYAIPMEGTVQMVPLLYRVDGDLLRTENPIAPHATATPIHQGPGGSLVLDFPDSIAVFLRES